MPPRPEIPLSPEEYEYLSGLGLEPDSQQAVKQAQAAALRRGNKLTIEEAYEVTFDEAFRDELAAEAGR